MTIGFVPLISAFDLCFGAKRSKAVGVAWSISWELNGDWKVLEARGTKYGKCFRVGEGGVISRVLMVEGMKVRGEQWSV